MLSIARRGDSTLIWSLYIVLANPSPFARSKIHFSSKVSNPDPSQFIVFDVGPIIYC